MRTFLILLFSLFMSLAVAGELQEEVPPKARITKRVLLVVDVSGSMVGANRIPEALAQVRDIASQPIDSMELAVIAFNGSFARWAGIPEPEHGIPEGWAALPSKEALDSAQTWLAGQGGGTTSFSGPLGTAMKEPRSDLTIVLLSDGITTHIGEPESTLMLVRTLQEWRIEHNYNKAVIYCIGLGPKQSWFSDLVKIGGGGLYYVAP